MFQGSNSKLVTAVMSVCEMEWMIITLINTYGLLTMFQVCLLVLPDFIHLTYLITL